MQLSYRGINYENSSLSLEVTEGEIIGKYRGQAWKYTYPKHMLHVRPKMYMQYRGVAYSTRALPINGQLSQNNISNSRQNKLTSCPVKVRSELPKQDTIQTIHLENIRRNLERRIAVAKSQGDLQLVTLLQQESQQLSRQV